MVTEIGIVRSLDNSCIKFVVKNGAAPMIKICKAKMKKNHQVLKLLKEKVNFPNLLVSKFLFTVKGIKPQYWQMPTNGPNFSKIDIIAQKKFHPCFMIQAGGYIEV